jgi:uncharacterized protein (DUF58 family)
LETNYRKYLDPLLISRLSNLELKARFVVEGFISGLHRSPYHGFSVEFSEHRQYMPGDDLRFLDWKVLGRTDRYYIKQFVEETNLKSYLIVDASRSMAFSSSSSEVNTLSPLKKLFSRTSVVRNAVSSQKVISKLEYATYLAASLSVLMHFQKDAAGLVVYDETINTYIPPKATSQNLKLILTRLSQIKPQGKTNTAQALDSVAERIKRRGLVIIFSDLFDDQNAVISSLKHFRYKRNEVIVFQILDPLEMSFAIDSPTIFKDMETEKELLSQPLSVLKSYQEAVRTFIDNYKRACRSDNIEYVLLSTQTPFDTALLEYLNKRKRLH